jgi:gas vesicle protein
MMMYDMMDEGNEGHGNQMFMAFGLGMACGIMAALLMAPASGSDTRRRLNEVMHDVTGKARAAADQAGGSLKREAQRLEHAFQEGRHAFMRETSNPGMNG